jgi:hypothetical protein
MEKCSAKDFFHAHIELSFKKIHFETVEDEFDASNDLLAVT